MQDKQSPNPGVVDVSDVYTGLFLVRGCSRFCRVQTQNRVRNPGVIDVSDVYTVCILRSRAQPFCKVLSKNKVRNPGVMDVSDVYTVCFFRLQTQHFGAPQLGNECERVVDESHMISIQINA